MTREEPKRGCAWRTAGSLLALGAIVGCTAPAPEKAPPQQQAQLPEQQAPVEAATPEPALAIQEGGVSDEGPAAAPVQADAAASAGDDENRDEDEDEEDEEDEAPEDEAPEYEGPAMLLAAGPTGTWAASDRRRLWIGSGTDVALVAEVGEAGPRYQSLEVDRQGRVWLVDSEGELLEAGPGRAPARRGQIPLDSIIALRVESPWWLALGELDEPKGEQGYHQLAISRDGRSWTLAAAPDLGNMESELVVDGDGLLQVITGSEAGCGGGYQSRFLARLDPTATAAPAALEWGPGDWPFDAAFDRHLGAGGWAFVHEPCVDEDTGKRIPDQDGWEGLCAIDRVGKQQVLHGFAGAYLLEHGHGQTLLLERGGLWVIEGDVQLKLVRLGDGQPALLGDGVNAAVADGAGHLLALTGALEYRSARLHRGGAEGWTSVALPGAEPSAR